MQPKTIKQLRKDLRAWGKFWRAKQLNVRQGVSTTEKICEMLKKGTFVDGVPTGAFDNSDSIKVKADYQRLDGAVDQLSKQCRVAIVNHYIKGRPQSGYWIDTAERALLTIGV